MGVGLIVLEPRSVAMDHRQKQFLGVGEAYQSLSGVCPHTNSTIEAGKYYIEKFLGRRAPCTGARWSIFRAHVVIVIIQIC
jgi:hypothetical protein